MKYIELKEKHQREVNDFPMFFAFSNSQFEAGMKKLGLEPNDTNKIYRLGDTGGFYKRSDSKTLWNMLDRHRAELETAMQDPEFAHDAFRYELANHEYVITGEVEDTLDALGLTLEEVNNNNVLKTALKKAIHDFDCIINI